jgi:hypothetical protein
LTPQKTKTNSNKNSNSNTKPPNHQITQQRQASTPNATRAQVLTNLWWHLSIYNPRASLAVPVTKALAQVLKLVATTLASLNPSFCLFFTMAYVFFGAIHLF